MSATRTKRTIKKPKRLVIADSGTLGQQYENEPDEGNMTLSEKEESSGDEFASPKNAQPPPAIEKTTEKTPSPTPDVVHSKKKNKNKKKRTTSDMFNEMDKTMVELRAVREREVELTQQVKRIKVEMQAFLDKI